MSKQDREWLFQDAMEMMADLERTANLHKQTWLRRGTPEQERYATYQAEAIGLASV